MNLSIIIVNWNVKEDIVNCLRSIEENKPLKEFEMIVVDNASTDGSVDTIKKDFPDVKLIANSGNLGFSAANNQAIRIAKGKYFFLLNPDTIIYPNSLDTLIAFLDDNADVGACGPKFLSATGQVHFSVGYVPTFRSLLYGRTFLRSLGIFRHRYKELTARNLNFEKTADVDQLSGAALMVRRSVTEEVGLMDESFFMYYEDVDLCLRIRKAGFRIVYLPDSIITHIGGRSSDQVSARKRIMLYRSLFVYFRKHRGKFATVLFSLIFKPGVIIDQLLNVLSGFVAYMFFILSFDRRRRLKSQSKIRNSASFLGRYLWIFLFKI
jgi:GT2 family glycosyltransferase